MMAVDILPASLPLDSSHHFSSVLVPYLNALIRQYRGEDVNSDISNALDRATVARHGKRSGKFRWLADSVTAWRECAGLLLSGSWTPTVGSISGQIQRNGLKQKKRILMVGSGMVAKPAVDEICKRSDVELLVGMYSPSYRQS
jgi:alpha-aminoadipic semialdehyde synthase